MPNFHKLLISIAQFPILLKTQDETTDYADYTDLLVLPSADKKDKIMDKQNGADSARQKDGGSSTPSTSSGQAGSPQAAEPINSIDYLEKLLGAGFGIKGPRKDASRDLAAFKSFLNKQKEFAPEDWLANNGYKFVEPSTFTEGHRIAYKMINDFPDERFSSNYSLIWGDREIPLYLKSEMPKAE